MRDQCAPGRSQAAVRSGASAGPSKCTSRTPVAASQALRNAQLVEALSKLPQLEMDDTAANPDGHRLVFTLLDLAPFILDEKGGPRAFHAALEAAIKEEWEATKVCESSPE